MDLSRKHHYLPVFYLKGFANENGFFHVYNHVKGKPEKREIHPKNVFFDERNLIEVNGLVSDVPEQMYSRVDDRHCNLFAKIREKREILELDFDDKMLLLEFISTLFWRIPAKDGILEKLFISDNDFLRQFRLISTSTGIEDEGLKMKLLRESPAFIKSLLPLYSIMAKYKKVDSLEFSRWQFVYNPAGDNICSDNPIIHCNPNAEDILAGDFVFPLSRFHLLIRTSQSVEGNEIPAPIMAYIQLLIFSQATLYSCCANDGTLKKLNVELPNVKQGNLLFSILHNSAQMKILNELYRLKSKYR